MVVVFGCSLVFFVIIVFVNILVIVNVGFDIVFCNGVFVNLNGVIGGGVSLLNWIILGIGMFGNSVFVIFFYMFFVVDIFVGMVLLILIMDDFLGFCLVVLD